MFVKCKNSKKNYKNSSITFGKEYEVIREGSENYFIRDDKKEVGWYNKRNFINVL